MSPRKKEVQLYGTCHGTTSLGERGQVVIPKKARSKLLLKKGDNFLVIEKDGVIILAPTRVVESMISNLSSLTEELKQSHLE